MKRTDIIKGIEDRMMKRDIDILIIPTEDPHLSEYPAQHWKLRQLISGFTGSNGLLILSKFGNGLWTDSRYFLQAEEELKGTNIIMYKDTESDWLSWLEKVPQGSRIAINGLCFSQVTVEKLEALCQSNHCSLETHFVLPEENELPPLPCSDLFIHDSSCEGRSFQEKKAVVFQKCSADYLLLAALDEIAWAFNLRASDIEFNPMPIAYALLGKQESHLFLCNLQLDKSVAQYFADNNINVHSYDETFDFVSSVSLKNTISVDAEKSNHTLYNSVQKEHLVREKSPIEQLKGIKSASEIRCIENAELKDGIALTHAFVEISERIEKRQTTTEREISTILLKHRSAQDGFFCESFSTIAGYGSNGAIVHYNAEHGSNALIGKESLLLVDSGANYLDGTTDITRVFCFGEPSEQQKKDYTAVLKGHIAIATCRFPYGTEGAHIDALARQFLWQEGLDYGHGTGHGIGFFLCVHEGPQRINRRFSGVKLEEGMILSDEPGIYRTNQYGIRIENMVAVEKYKESEFGKFLQFKTLTLFPYERKLILKDLLTQKEIDWINQYHQRVYNAIVTHLSDEREIMWLKNVTKEL